MRSTRTGRPEWAPQYLEMDQPNTARMYDYFLGGAHNFAIDRETARTLVQEHPERASVFRGHRSFQRRAVRYLVDAGIDQFLTLGSGIPTVGNVHEVAQKANPEARVAYVDVDPLTVAHSRTILGDHPTTTAVQADLRQSGYVLDHPVVRELLDLDRPVAVMMVSALQFMTDSDDPAGIVASYRRAVVPGSYVVISHGSAEATSTAEDIDEWVDAVNRYFMNPFTYRTRAEIATLFEGLELVPPGLVQLAQWHPDSDDEPTPAFAGVGRKP